MVGARYSRGGEGDYARWGRQQGSVYLGDQKVAVTVPRVRNLRRQQEVPLASYQALGRPRRVEEAALLKVLKGLSCRDDESCVEPVAETFGLTASSLSRRFKRASAKKLAELTERDLSEHDLVALFLDGKTFGDDQMVIGLGVPLEGEKVDYWKNADQKHRWLATALLDIEPRLNNVCGCKQLTRLRTALQTNLKGCLDQVP